MTKILAYAILAIGIIVHVNTASTHARLDASAWPWGSDTPYTWLGFTLSGYALCATYAWKNPYSLVAIVVGTLMLWAEIGILHSPGKSSVGSSMAIGALPILQLSIALVGSIVGAALSVWHRALLGTDDDTGPPK